MAKVDPSVYDTPTFEIHDPLMGKAPAAPAAAPEPVSQSKVLGGTAGVTDAMVAQQEAQRERAGAFKAVGSAASEWSVRHAWDHFNAPTFEFDETFVASKALDSVRSQLSDDDRAFLLASKSSEEFQYKVTAMERARTAYRDLGDSPIAGFTAMMLDPGYLAIDVASMGAGRLAALARVGVAGERLAAAGVAGVGALALGEIEAQAIPMSQGEIVAGALLNGAATGMLYRAGKLERIDPAHPTAELTDLAENLRTQATSRESTAHKLPDATHPELKFEAPDAAAPRTGTDLAQVVSSHYRGTDLQDIADSILNAPELGQIKVTRAAADYKEGGLGYWHVRPDGSNRLYIKEGATTETALHELVHAVVQSRVFQNPSRVAELSRVRDNVIDTMKTMAKANPEFRGPSNFYIDQFSKLPEFLAYSMSSPKFRSWAKSVELLPNGKPLSAASAAEKALYRQNPPEGKLSLWDKIMDFVSNVVGKGRPRLEKLMDSGATPPVFKKLDERLNELAIESREIPSDLLRQRQAKYNMDAPEYSLDPSVSTPAIASKFDEAAKATGKAISWSLYKSLAQYGPEATRAARLLVDDPIDMAGDSVVSQTRAIRADLAALQFRYEDSLKEALAKDGFGIRNRILKPKQAIVAQQKLERSVAAEMLARDRANRLGIQFTSEAPDHIRHLADQLDQVYSAALKEMKAAGVEGAEEIAEKSGYFSRRWDSAKLQELEDALGGDKAAQAKLNRMVATGLRRANGWDAELAADVGKAILDRARRKGQFEDSAFRAHAGNEALKEVRDILTDSGVRGDRLNRAMDVLAGKVDEAGKTPVLKHRVEMDMKAGMMMPDGTFITIADLIDTNLTRATEQYLDNAAGRAALARKGLGSVTAVADLRQSVLKSIPAENKRGDAAKLFDQVMNSIMGRPVGEDMPAMMRNVQALTRMVGLASSGLWQVTEYATAMAKYGALKTLKYTIKEMPGFSSVLSSAKKDKGFATQLKDLLARNSSEDIRLRPFVQRMEDNFEIAPSDHVQLALLQAQQLVPYLNAQKFVQQHQARVVANLVTDTFMRGARGDVRAVAVLEQYGLKSGIIDQIKDDIKAAGTDTTKWTDGTWAQVRGPLMKMMDDAVLRNRTGEIPAFAQFNSAGKFIFTFRSFVLGAHNKVLAGTLGRDGFAGVGLLALYQFPLAMLATEINSTIQNKPIKDMDDLVHKSMGQMGSMGLFSEIWGIASGTKQQFGAPGLIAIDRLYKTAGDAFSGDMGQAGAGLLSATPILSLIPGVRAIGETLKD